MLASGMPPNNTDELHPFIPDIETSIAHNIDKLKIGVAQYEEGPTGCTVMIFEDNDGQPVDVNFYADRRGGSIGAVFDDFGIAQGFCLSGGSLYGLEANFGVIQYFHEKAGFSNHWMQIPDIPGAIVYDFGPRENSVYPDKRLGYEAARNAVPGKIPIGRYGAGRMTTVGKGFDYTLGEFSGQGGAYREIGEVKILVLVVLNAIGALRDRDGTIIKGHLDRTTGKRIELLDQMTNNYKISDNKTTTSQNTTLTVVVTNKKFSSYHLKQISRQVHSSMSKMIDPFHTANDGDILFFASTNELEDNHMSDIKFGLLATEVVWDAVLSVNI